MQELDLTFATLHNILGGRGTVYRTCDQDGSTIGDLLEEVSSGFLLQ